MLLGLFVRINNGIKVNIDDLSSVLLESVKIHLIKFGMIDDLSRRKARNGLAQY